MKSRNKQTWEDWLGLSLMLVLLMAFFGFLIYSSFTKTEEPIDIHTAPMVKVCGKIKLAKIEVNQYGATTYVALESEMNASKGVIFQGHIEGVYSRGMRVCIHMWEDDYQNTILKRLK